MPESDGYGNCAPACPLSVYMAWINPVVSSTQRTSHAENNLPNAINKLVEWGKSNASATLNLITDSPLEEVHAAISSCGIGSDKITISTPQEMLDSAAKHLPKIKEMWDWLDLYGKIDLLRIIQLLNEAGSPIFYTDISAIPRDLSLDIDNLRKSGFKGIAFGVVEIRTNEQAQNIAEDHCCSLFQNAKHGEESKRAALQTLEKGIKHSCARALNTLENSAMLFRPSEELSRVTQFLFEHDVNEYLEAYRSGKPRPQVLYPYTLMINYRMLQQEGFLPKGDTGQPNNVPNPNILQAISIISINRFHAVTYRASTKSVKVENHCLGKSDKPVEAFAEIYPQDWSEIMNQCPGAYLKRFEDLPVLRGILSRPSHFGEASSPVYSKS